MTLIEPNKMSFFFIRETRVDPRHPRPAWRLI